MTSSKPSNEDTIRKLVGDAIDIAPSKISLPSAFIQECIGELLETRPHVGKVIADYYGRDGPPKTRKEIAVEIGHSRVRVHHIFWEGVRLLREIAVRRWDHYLSTKQADALEAQRQEIVPQEREKILALLSRSYF